MVQESQPWVGVACLLPAGTPGMDQENVLARNGQRRAIMGNKNLLHIPTEKYEARRRMSRRSSRPGGRWTNRPAKNACLKGCREMEVRTAMGSTCDGNCRLGRARAVSVQGMPGRHTADRHALRLFFKAQILIPGGATSRSRRQSHRAPLSFSRKFRGRIFPCPFCGRPSCPR